MRSKGSEEDEGKVSSVGTLAREIKPFGGTTGEADGQGCLTLVLRIASWMKASILVLEDEHEQLSVLASRRDGSFRRTRLGESGEMLSEGGRVWDATRPTKPPVRLEVRHSTAQRYRRERGIKIVRT